MGWNHDKARQRILQFQAAAPVIRVERFETEYLGRRSMERAARQRFGLVTEEAPPLYDLPDGAAVLVDTAQVYVQALGYDEVRLENGRETERGHQRALSFLHLLYAAADRVVGHAGAQRVDFHGARMHAVVIEPSGVAGIRERVAKALQLALEMIALAKSAGPEITRGQNFPLRFRVGVDAGLCVAINSGRHDEREPMFIGPAANHAAKLADGDQEGVFLSDSVRRAFELPARGSLIMERAIAASAPEVSIVEAAAPRTVLEATASRQLGSWLDDVRAHRTATCSPDMFVFHHHAPPLSTIDYGALMPSNSIRMPLVSMFADLDRYTAYIDRCMQTDRLPEAVRLLHIIRSEFNAVLQKDFNGRKVRFIGDCVHGVIAAGNARETDKPDTVQLAARCAGGLRSSFNLCQALIAGGDQVGLAIGLELGETPISRIGIRGDRSVRIASSIACKRSEGCQQACDGTETMMGPNALAAAPARVRGLFGERGKCANLTFPIVETAIGAPAMTSSGLAILRQPARAHSPQQQTARAHCRG